MSDNTSTPPHRHYAGGPVLGGRVCTSSECHEAVRLGLVCDPDTGELMRPENAGGGCMKVDTRKASKITATVEIDPDDLPDGVGWGPFEAMDHDGVVRQARVTAAGTTFRVSIDLTPAR